MPILVSDGTLYVVQKRQLHWLKVSGGTYGEDNGHTTYVTENGTVYKDSPASYYYIKNYLSNSASKGTGNGSYTYKDKDGNTVTKQWTITNEEFLDSNALTQTEITEITKKKNPGLVDRGFDRIYMNMLRRRV